jgi:hypothetical protein
MQAKLSATYNMPLNSSDNTSDNQYFFTELDDEMLGRSERPSTHLEFKVKVSQMKQQALFRRTLSNL